MLISVTKLEQASNSMLLKLIIHIWHIFIQFITTIITHLTFFHQMCQQRTPEIAQLFKVKFLIIIHTKQENKTATNRQLCLGYLMLYNNKEGGNKIDLKFKTRLYALSIKKKGTKADNNPHVCRHQVHLSRSPMRMILRAYQFNSLEFKMMRISKLL